MGDGKVSVVAPPLRAEQEQSWLGLLDLSAHHGPDGWCLVGGQLVHLLCWERSVSPARATDDGDAVADVRGTGSALRILTDSLLQLGFTAGRETIEGKQHRWVRDLAIIDVLVPTRVDRFTERFTVNRRETIAAPGAQQALDRSERVELTVADRTGVIRRPNLLGSLVVKAAAYRVDAEPGRARHIQDFAVLASMIGRRDLPRDGLRRCDRSRLSGMTVVMRHRRSLWAPIDGAADGLARIDQWLGTVAG